MASVTAVRAFVFAIALLFVAVSAQEVSPASSPAPSPEVGAAGSVSGSAAMIGASIVLSMLAALKF